MRKHVFIDFNVHTSTPFICITPIDSFNHVEFREELLTSTPKHSSHPELLRQLALEDSIWILTDSKSYIQYLKKLAKYYGQFCSRYFIQIRLGQKKQVCIPWIPSHVGVPGNIAADELASRGCHLLNPSSTVLTHKEIPSFQRNKMNLTWRNPPAHHWYSGKSPSLSIQSRSSKAYQTALARLRSGRLRTMTFVQA
ncbi:RNase H domain-containing protein [Trichonephila clavipes]|nr:RNase H domain-containing protein [Trichonephila clavipes]